MENTLRSNGNLFHEQFSSKVVLNLEFEINCVAAVRSPPPRAFRAPRADGPRMDVTTVRPPGSPTGRTRSLPAGRRGRTPAAAADRTRTPPRRTGGSPRRSSRGRRSAPSRPRRRSRPRTTTTRHVPYARGGWDAFRRGRPTSRTRGRCAGPATARRPAWAWTWT